MESFVQKYIDKVNNANDKLKELHSFVYQKILQTPDGEVRNDLNDIGIKIIEIVSELNSPGNPWTWFPAD